MDAGGRPRRCPTERGNCCPIRAAVCWQSRTRASSNWWATWRLSPKKLQVFFMEIPQSFAKPFRSAGPATPLKLTSPATAAVDPQSGNVVTYSRGELTLLVRQGNDYHRRADRVGGRRQGPGCHRCLRGLHHTAGIGRRSHLEL